MSNKALKSIAAGKLDAAAMMGDDAQAFADAGGACAKEIGGN